MSINLNVELPKTFSPSQVNTFRDCPARWALSRSNSFKAKTNSMYLDLGSIVHNSINNYYRSIPHDQEITKEYIKSQVKSAFYDIWLSHRIPSLEPRFNRSLANFTKFEVNRLKSGGTYLPAKTEWAVKKHWEGYNLYGIIDFYSRDTKTIIDWKTGSKAELNLSYLFQGEFYRLLANLSHEECETVIFMFINLGEALIVPKRDFNWLKESLDLIVLTAKVGEFKKNKESYCSNCNEIWACDYSDTPLWETWP